MSMVYQYGLLRPIGNADKIREQLRFAHDYRNILVKIEKDRRATVRDALLGYKNTASLYQLALEAQEEAGKAKKVIEQYKERTGKSKGTDVMEARRVRAYAKSHEATTAFYANHKAAFADPAVAAIIKDANERARGERLAARSETKTYWGTYLLVEAAMKQSAQKTSLYFRLKPHEPHFVRWTREGSLSVQIQNGMDGAEVFAEDTRLQIAPVDELAWLSSTKSERRKLSHTTLKMRVESDEKGKPIWGTWPMIMHRPLPDGCRIKRATVTCHRIANAERWKLNITVEEGILKRPPSGKGPVGIDLGWRARPDGSVRIASWYGFDGGHAEVVLSATMMEGLERPHTIRSIRGKMLEAFRPELVAAVKETKPPKTLHDKMKHMHLWRAAAKFDSLFSWWRKNRYEGDETPFALLEQWRHRDRHLWQYESHQRDNSLLRRRELYRITARELARRYGTAVLERFNISAVAGKDSTDNDQARANRQTVAVSTFRTAVIQAFTEYATVPAPGTTFMCHGCGSVEVWDQAKEVEHTCSQCGEHWDQDYNAAVNILGLYKKGGDKIKTFHPDPLRPPGESHWAKVKRLRREKTTAVNDAAE